MMRLGGMDYRDKAKIYIFSHQVNKNDKKLPDFTETFLSSAHFTEFTFHIEVMLALAPFFAV